MKLDKHLVTIQKEIYKRLEDIDGKLIFAPVEQEEIDEFISDLEKAIEKIATQVRKEAVEEINDKILKIYNDAEGYYPDIGEAIVDEFSPHLR